MSPRPPPGAALPLGLAALCLLLTLRAFAPGPAALPATAPPAAPADAARPPAAAAFAPQPLQAFAEVAARPLFAPTRRPPQPLPPPPAPPQATAPEPPPPPPEPEPTVDFALVGVVARNGAGIALVHLAEGRTLQLREGDQLGPWVVKWIGDRSAVFRQGRHDVELTLDFKHPAATPGGN